MYKSLVCCVFCLLSLIPAVHSPALQSANPPVQAESRGAQLWVNGQRAFTFEADLGGLPPETRARIAADRVRAAGLDGQVTVTMVMVGKQARLLFDGNEGVTAGRPDAHRAGMTVARLGQHWVQRLRLVLSAQAIQAPLAAVIVPVGEQRVIPIGGWLDGPVSVASSPAGLADCTTDGRNIIIRGVSPGVIQMQATVQQWSRPFTVRVMKYAGEWRLPPTVEVSGSPASADFIRRTVRAAVLRHTRLEPGAVLEIAPVDNSKPLDLATSTAVTVRARSSGPGLLPRAWTQTVQVRNVGAAPARPTHLTVSNYPETFSRYQVLTETPLDTSADVRMLYHHANGLPSACRFIIEVMNPHDHPITVRLSGYAARPFRDPVRAGFEAGRGFMLCRADNRSQLITVDGRTVQPLLVQRLPAGFTASGVVLITPQSSLPGALSLRVRTDDQLQMPVCEGGADTWAAIAPVPLFDAPTLRPAQAVRFSVADKRLDARYEVGKTWQFIRIGERAITDDSGRRLDGNYGVIYSLDIEIVNPQERPVNVELAFEPSAGIAAAVFSISGHLRAVPSALPPHEHNMWQLRLEPGARRTIRVETMPLAGSNYPATLLVRS